APSRTGNPGGLTAALPDRGWTEVCVFIVASPLLWTEVLVAGDRSPQRPARGPTTTALPSPVTADLASLITSILAKVSPGPMSGTNKPPSLPRPSYPKKELVNSRPKRPPGAENIGPGIA